MAQNENKDYFCFPRSPSGLAQGDAAKLSRFARTMPALRIKPAKATFVFVVLFGFYFLVSIFYFLPTAKAAILGNDLSLILSPDTPGPGQNFSVEARSYDFDTSHADFTWYLDGKKIEEGLGVTKENFSAGRTGSQMNIRVVTELEDGSSFAAESKIVIADVDLVLNPLTYVPAWYKGAALPSAGSVVEVYAVPHLFSGGKRLDPTNLIYDWSLDRNKVADQSGTGKNVFRVKLPNSRNSENEVALLVSSIGGSVAAKKRIMVTGVSPKILFYQSSPLTGIKSWASAFFAARPSANFSITAEPFFFALQNLANLNVAWSADGEDLNQVGVENPFRLDIKTPAEGGAAAIFSLKIGTEKNLFQRAEANLSVTTIQQ